MSDYYQCEITSTTTDKTLAKESNSQFSTMFIYIFIFIVIFACVFYYNSTPENAKFFHIRIFIFLLLFILFGILIAAIVNVN